MVHIITQLKWSLLMWNKAHILTLVKKLMINILNLKLVVLLEYQNIKAFLRKAIFQIGLKKFLWLKKFKNTMPWTYVIIDLKDEEIVGTFYEKKLQKKKEKKEEFRVEKIIKRTGNKLYFKWKSCDCSFNSWIDKKDIV